MNGQPKVAILGAGISGLLAAWALERLNIPFLVFDKGPKEALPRIVPGCVYLHDPCNLPASALRKATMWTQVLPPGPINQIPPETYSQLYHRKIWGTSYDYVQNSVDGLFVDHRTGVVGQFNQIFSMNAALAFLYARFRNKVMIKDLGADDVQLLLNAGMKVISTIPMGVFAPGKPFISKPTWITQMPETKRRPDGLPEFTGATAMTIYNVDWTIPWYRASSMFGFYSVEFIEDPGGIAAKFKKIISGPRPEDIETGYPGLMLTGRWGRWQRGFLSHQTYHDVLRRFG